MSIGINIKKRYDFKLKKSDDIILDIYLLKTLKLELFPIIEESLQIKLEDDELSEISNFDELCSLIIGKLDLDCDNLCTTRLAFYKLRKAIADMGYEGKLTPDSELEDIFPKYLRIYLVKKLEYELGFKTDLLGYSSSITLNILFAFFVNFLFMTIHYTSLIGVPGMIVFGVLITFVFRYGRNLKFKTIREWVQGTACENYFEYRGNTNSINKQEFRNVLMDWFSSNLYEDKSFLQQVRFR